MKMLHEEAPAQLGLALDHSVGSQLLPTSSVDEQSSFLSASRGNRSLEPTARSRPTAALATPLGRNIPAQTSRSAKPAAIPALLCSPTSTYFVSASPEATVESRKVKGRKLFITAAYRNAISPALRGSCPDLQANEF